MGSKGQTISFSESSHVAYQIKADDADSNMVANILPTDTPLTQGLGSKGQTIFLLKVVMLHIKLKGIEHRAPWKQVCCHYTHQRPLGLGQKVIFCSFLKVVMLHIKVKWKKCRPTCKVTLWIDTQSWPLRLGLKVRYLNCADVSIFFIELSTKTYLTGVCYYLNDTVGVLRVR